MKKIILIAIFFAILGFSSCLFEINADVNQDLGFSVPTTNILVPPFTDLDIYIENDISNQGQGVMGDYAQITELRLTWSLSNRGANPVTIGIGITGVGTASGSPIPVFNGSQPYYTNGQTAWIVPLMTLAAGQKTNQVYTSGLNTPYPLLYQLMISSNRYQIVFHSVLSNQTAGVVGKDVDLEFIATVGMTLERATAEVPGIVSLFQ